MNAPAETPLLAAEEAKIAVDGVTAIDRLTLATAGDRVLFAGDPGALFAAVTGVPLSTRRAARPVATVKGKAVAAVTAEDLDDEMPGEAFVVGGSLRLAGRSVADGSHVPIMGAAPLDPPLPSGWTVEEYIAWGAQLAGATPRAAVDLAQAAMARVGLAPARKRSLGTLSPAERRVLVLGQAIVMSPEVLIAEAPLGGLEGAPALMVREALAGASEGRRTMLSALRIDPGSTEGALARSATYLVLLAGGEVALEGAPGELFSGAKVYSLLVRSRVDELRAELSGRGIGLRGGPHRFVVELPVGATTREILLAAKAAKAAVIELMPMIG